MQLVQPFNAMQFDPTQGTGGFPVGKHPVIIKGSEVKPNKDNTGGYLQLDCEIIDGPSKGVIGAYRLNLYNNSAQAVEIAHRQLSAICHCVGVFNVQDSQQLHNLPFIIEVGPQKDPQYTEVKKVFDIQGNEPGKKPPQQPAQPMAPQAPQQPQATPQQQPAWAPTNAPVVQPQAPQAQPQAPAWGQPQAPQQQPQAPQGAPAWAQGQAPQQPQAPAGWQQGATSAPPWAQR